jgi:hypothetical protein
MQTWKKSSLRCILSRNCWPVFLGRRLFTSIIVLPESWCWVCWLGMFPNLFLLFVAEFLHLYTSCVSSSSNDYSGPCLSFFLAPAQYPQWVLHRCFLLDSRPLMVLSSGPTVLSHWTPDISAFPKRQCWPQFIADTAHSPSSWPQSSEIYYEIMTPQKTEELTVIKRMLDQWHLVLKGELNF